MATVKIESVDEEMEVEEEPEDSSSNLCKYCKNELNPYTNPGLTCIECDKGVHIECLRSCGTPGGLSGDVFFEFTCAECNSQGQETITRVKMSWLNAIILTLFNLKEKSWGISKKGYFHWQEHISVFVDRNWEVLFPKNFKRRKNWKGTISGTLSHNSSIFFQRGNDDLEGIGGFWKLKDADPPEIQMSKNNQMIQERKKTPGVQVKNPQVLKTSQSPPRSESSLSVGDDSCGEASRIQTPSMFSREYVQPTEFLSNFLLEDDDIPDINILEDEMIIPDNLDVNEQPTSTLLNDLIKDFQVNNNSGAQYCQMFNPEWMNNILNSEAREEEEEEEQEEQDEQDQEEEEEGSRSDSSQELPASLFTTSKRRNWPWIKSETNARYKPKMSKSEEEFLLQSISRLDLDSMPPNVRRLYRKLALRKLKRGFNIPLTDFDSFNNKKYDAEDQSGNRVIDRFCHDSSFAAFEQRLQGYCEPICVHSPYTNRLLKPFIRRDSSSRPLWIRVMQELCAKVHRNDPGWVQEPMATIDYCYVRPQHIPAINSLCSQFFWSGIDMTECLQYPDFTCVALYKKLVIGFGIVVPDVGHNEAYISFFLTRPEWRRAGIGTFMLYHLIQTSMGKDCTLHVSATNPALILYQKFGFKIEEFVQDFYEKYMRCDAKESRHALFLRLSR